MGTKTLDAPVASEVLASSASANKNSKSTLMDLARAGQLTWAGPLVVLVARCVFMIAAQAVAVGVIALRSHVWSWNAAAKWWTVYGTLVDVGCLSLMAAFTRKEGIRLRDLIGRVRLRWGHDLWLGAGILCLAFPFFVPGARVATWLAYRGGQPPLFPGMLAGRILPLWAVVYTFAVWLLIWSPTEEMTYQGYVLPRIEALSHRRWIAVTIVSFWWALQHVFLPFIPDWKYVVWRFVAFLPSMIVMTLLYLKVRRLPPFFVAHWTMDTIAIFMTLKL
jgi:uncharacterized protein